MTGRRRWSTEEILDTAAELLRTSDADSFSVRKLAAALGTDSSSLYRHFRNKTELLRAVADRILLAAMDGYRPAGDWKQRITALALRLRKPSANSPQLAGGVWGGITGQAAPDPDWSWRSCCRPCARPACPTRRSRRATTAS